MRHFDVARDDAVAAGVKLKAAVRLSLGVDHRVVSGAAKAIDLAALECHLPRSKSLDDIMHGTIPVSHPRLPNSSGH
jgi:hypothetical protein